MTRAVLLRITSWKANVQLRMLLSNDALFLASTGNDPEERSFDGNGTTNVLSTTVLPATVSQVWGGGGYTGARICVLLFLEIWLLICLEAGSAAAVALITHPHYRRFLEKSDICRTSILAFWNNWESAVVSCFWTFKVFWDRLRSRKFSVLIFEK